MQKTMKVDIERLHPTQVTIGMLEVQQKLAHFQSLTPAERKRAIKSHPMPTVLGPNGLHFIIDHHHLARALHEARVAYAYSNIVDDFSALPAEPFWDAIIAKRWVHPNDEHGLLRGIAAIPTHVSGLVDDPYRSLAAFVRDAGGYVKIPEPFADFLWADFFRMRVRMWTTNFQFDAAVQQGIHLASSPDARTLPGFVHGKPGKPGSPK